MRTQRILLVGLALMALVGGGCSLDTPKQSANRDPITIGWIGPLTGDAAEYGEPIKNSVELTVDTINTEGGVGGRPLKVVYEDGKCSGKDAATAAHKLISIDRVTAIIGGVCSSETLAAAPIAETEKVVLISPSATSPDITDAGDYVFRNMPSDFEGGRAMAELVNKKFHSVALLSEDTSYNQGIKKVFSDRFAELQGIVQFAGDYPQNERDFRTYLTKAKASGAETLVINAQTSVTAGYIAKQARELGYAVPIYGNMGLVQGDALKIAGTALNNALVVDAPDVDSSRPEVQKFFSVYKEKYGNPTYPIYMAAAHDDVLLLKQAIEAAQTGASIQSYLYGLSTFKGFAGDYHFDTNGDVVGLHFQIKQVQNGKVIAIQ